jgi:hypothetical protein
MKRRFWFLLAALLFAEASAGRAQDSSIVTDGFHYTPGLTAKKALASGLAGTIMLGTMVDSYFSWWKDAEKPFSFLDHQYENWLWGSHKGLDKVGHFLGTYVLFKSIHNILLWGGCDRSTALWWGAGYAFWNGLETEIGDGFSPYGFDYQDLVFDIAGVAFGLLRTDIPFLQNFDFKFSFWSAAGFRTPANFTTDYDAMTVWLTANVHNLLPVAIRDYWPRFLRLGVGYSVDDRETRAEVAVGLDISIESLFRAPNEEILMVQRALDIVHLPLPAVKFTQGKVPRYHLAHRD